MSQLCLLLIVKVECEQSQLNVKGGFMNASSVCAVDGLMCEGRGWLLGQPAT